MENSNKLLRNKPSAVLYPWRTIFKRAAVIAVFLGSSLTVVNQLDAVLGTVEFQVLPLILVFLTPFLVVSVSQVLGIREAHKLTAFENLDGFVKTLFAHGIPIRAISLGLSIGATNTLIVMSSVPSLDQLPLALMIQGLTLPILFGAISQTLSFRRTVAQFARA